MNWDAVGAIAELVGGLGVIVTLIFLALQIRHNSQTVQNETLSALNDRMTANMMTFAQSGELSKILRTGLNNFKSLSQVDRFRFHLGIATTLRHFETAFLAWRRGLLARQSWIGFEAMLLELIVSEGVRDYWDGHRQTYSDEFREHVLAMIAANCIAVAPAEPEPAAPEPPLRRRPRHTKTRPATAHPVQDSLQPA